MRIPDFVEKRWERVKKWQARLPRLPRRWRIVRNLAVTAALAFLALDLELLDWPSFSPYGAFQRVESAYLLTPSRLVLQVDSGWGAGFLTEGDSWITLGASHKYQSSVLSPASYQANLVHVLPKEGIVVAALPAKNEQGGLVVAVWGAPPEAAAGTLELDLEDVEDIWRERPVMERETFTAQARRQEDGWFIFQFAPHSYHPEDQFCAMDMVLWGAFLMDQVGEQSYRLTLADSRGAAVVSQAGTLPPDQWLSQW